MTMFPPENKATRLSSVNHTIKAIQVILSHTRHTPPPQRNCLAIAADRNITQLLTQYILNYWKTTHRYL